MTWKQTGVPRQVRFKLVAVLEIGPGISFPVAVGTKFTGGGLFLTGTGLPSSSPEMTITAVDHQRGDFTAEAEVTHTYGGDETRFPASWGLPAPPADGAGRTRFDRGHINNGVDPDGPPMPATVRTVVDLSVPESPESLLPPVVKCRLRTVCQFGPRVKGPVDGLRFRLATPAELGQSGSREFAHPGPPQATHAATVDPETGVFSWNTTGAQRRSAGRSFYSTQIVIERKNAAGDVVVASSADFVIELTDEASGCVDTDDDGSSDDDQDGLCDSWETTGIDVDDDGEVDLKLYDGNRDGTISASERGDPDVPDVFVEVDYMPLLRPSPTALDAVVRAFAAAPRPIRLHYVVDDMIPFAENTIFTGCPADCPAGAVDFNDRKAEFFGTAGERAGTHSDKVLESKRLAFHYAQWIHGLAGYGTTSGRSEVGGNDLVVSLGRWGLLFGRRGGTADDQAGTFMHELGHNFGLRHGGGDNVQCKPNYLSVMNYARQFEGGMTPHRRLDYSRAALPTLDEAALVEANGIGVAGPSDEVVAHGPGRIRVSPVAGPIDWDDGQPEGPDVPVSADINDLGNPSCVGAGTMLTGYDDWANLDLRFHDSPDFADGAGTTVDEQSEELTYDALAAISPDDDDDGVRDIDDLCRGRADPGQEDRDGDGVGDRCQPQARDDRFAAPGGRLIAPRPGILANDTLGGALLTRQTVTTANGGRATIKADGSVDYAAAAGFTGTDSFEYVLENSPAASTATARIDVAAAGAPQVDPPSGPGAAGDGPPPAPPGRSATIGKITATAKAGGKIRLRIATTGAGALQAVATIRRRATPKRGGKPVKTVTVRYGSARRTLRSGGTVTVTIAPGTSLLRTLRKTKRLPVALAVTLAPGRGATTVTRRARVTARLR
ncbi:hypothetical protein PAI11_39410 [Patulibacter medicamentivorans]|uniref:Uncharacterized protein n=1 Tax=Patulibacter medicamentivorans TaxID=1097667 RepID=H0EAR7_9ACTN|nr:hypothetical protein PAI11_39410 [Patulibacter medicamentivorans]